MSSGTSLSGPTIPLGVTPQGLSVWRQSDWTQSLQAGWQQAFGSNVNLAPQSVNGQLIAIFAERFALLTELLEAIYQAQYPGGAEGVAVDNQLALVGLTRSQATATITAPTPVILSNGITQYGFVLYGTPGTVVRAGTMFGDSASPPNPFTLNSAVTIGGAQNAQQSLSLGASPTSGTFALTLTNAAGETCTTEAIDYRAMAAQTVLVFGPGSDNGYTLTIGTKTTGTLFANDDPGLLAGALNTLLGITTVAAAQGAMGAYIVWPAGPIPVVTGSGSGLIAVIDAIQASINAATAPDGTQPFSDVAVTGGAQAYAINFGANTPATGQTATSAQAMPLAVAANNTLLANQTAVNIAINNVILGQTAQGIGQATASATGPISVSPGALTNVLTPLQGLTSVTNPLACVTGQSVEADSQALLRRSQELSASAQGPLGAILEKVRNLAGVTNALAFTNTANAAQQLVVFSKTPTVGSYQLVLESGSTGNLPFSATASDIQAAIRALPGLSQAVVTGNTAYGVQVDLAGAFGGQAVPLMSVVYNTTDAAISAFYGRLPKSLELVVEGGDPQAIAQAIYSFAPAGIATYGAAVARPVITTTSGSSVITVDTAANLVPGLNISCPAIPYSATIVTIVGLQVTMSASATSSVSNVATVAGYAPVITDSQGNAVVVHFSRPQVVSVYVVATLITDFYNTPSVPSSGINPSAKWQPASVATIQSDIVASLEQVPIGGVVVGLGTNGVRASLSSVAGITQYEIAFDLKNNPTNTGPIQLLPEQLLGATAFNVQVTWS